MASLSALEDVFWDLWGLLSLWGRKTDFASLLSFLGKQILFPSHPG